MADNLLSVIIPTSGSASALEETIQSLCRVDVPSNGAEVVVVQNGPLNSSLEKKILGMPKSNNGLEFCFCHEPTAGLLAGRHRGVKVAKGDVLVFIDDDVSVSPSWLIAIARSFEDRGVHLVGGRNVPRYDRIPPEWVRDFWSENKEGDRWCGFLSLLDFGGTRKQIDPSFVWGLNFAIRRESLLAVSGFHPDGVPWEMRRFRGDGESGVAAKIKTHGLTAIYQPHAEVTHIVPSSRLTIEYFEKRAHLQGISDSFSRLRASHFQPDAVQEKKQKRSITRRFAGRIKRAILGQSPSSIEYQRTSQAYQAGYDYHQAEFQKDEHLRQWVLRNDYWDYSYPKTGEN